MLDLIIYDNNTNCVYYRMQFYILCVFITYYVTYTCRSLYIYYYFVVLVIQSFKYLKKNDFSRFYGTDLLIAQSCTDSEEKRDKVSYISLLENINRL